MINIDGNAWIVKVPITYGGFTLQRDDIVLYLETNDGWSEILVNGHFRSYPSKFFQRVLNGGALLCIEYAEPTTIN